MQTCSKDWRKSNSRDVRSVVRAFGFFMGTLVLWNFVNVSWAFDADAKSGGQCIVTDGHGCKMYRICVNCS